MLESKFTSLGASSDTLYMHSEPWRDGQEDGCIATQMFGHECDLREETYFEFSHNSVLIRHILVVVVATFTSEQVETVEPVLKVVKLTLQFFWVYLSGERNRKRLLKD